MIPFKGKTKVAKAKVPSGDPFPYKGRKPGAAPARLGKPAAPPSKMPSDLGGDWQNVPYPSKNPK